MPEYKKRLADTVLEELLGELPAVMVVGPRATGKTTTAERHVATVIRLDVPAQAAVFRADPDAALMTLVEPVLLDEWQEVPSILGAVKRSVDRDSSPGRYVLTGSVRADLDYQTWPGTGRVVRIAMYGMTVGEQQGRLSAASFLDRVVGAEPLGVPRDPPDLRGYVELALRSGFPEVALNNSDSATKRWLESYVDQLVTRDVKHLESGRDPVLLRKYLEALALNSAGTVSDVKLIEAAGIDRKTALAYEGLLGNLLVVEALPAWTTNRVKRLARAPKRFVVDPALIAAVLGLDERAFMRDGNLLGRLLETFVVAQLRTEAALSSPRPRLYHLRDEHGRHEIDVVAESGAGDVIAIEVKADSAPGRDAAKHLVWLRDRLGERFIQGVVLHTGPRPFVLDDRIVAVPICTMWA